MRTAAERIRTSGMRDYSTWGHGIFPGRVGPTDLDGVVHAGGSNTFLVLEFKNAEDRVPQGQAILLQGLARLPEFTVYVVWERDGRVCAIGSVNPWGIETTTTTHEDFLAACQRWSTAQNWRAR